MSLHECHAGERRVRSDCLAFPTGMVEYRAAFSRLC